MFDDKFTYLWYDLDNAMKAKMYGEEYDLIPAFNAALDALDEVTEQRDAAIKAYNSTEESTLGYRD